MSVALCRGVHKVRRIFLNRDAVFDENFIFIYRPYYDYHVIPYEINRLFGISSPFKPKDFDHYPTQRLPDEAG